MIVEWKLLVESGNRVILAMILPQIPYFQEPFVVFYSIYWKTHSFPRRY